MSAVFDKRGRRIPITQIMAGPNVVLSLGDAKAKIAFGMRRRVKKPQSEFLKIAGFAPRYVKEVKVKVESGESSREQNKELSYSPGDKVTVSIFEPGDEVKVTGTTRGRGFAGVIKRWGFAGGPKTHGQSDRHRAPGSIGQATTPGRVFKGKKMAGHMGDRRLTIRGLEVVGVDTAKNILAVSGAVPGACGGFLIIEKIGKVKGYTPPPPQKEDEEDKKQKEQESTDVKNEENNAAVKE